VSGIARSRIALCWTVPTASSEPVTGSRLRLAADLAKKRQRSRVQRSSTRLPPPADGGSFGTRAGRCAKAELRVDVRYLIDTNVVIPLEPTAAENLESSTPAAAELIRRLSEARIQTLVHPACLDDLARDRDVERRTVREVLVQKYPQLESPPSDADIESEVGRPTRRSNEWVDNQLLAAVHANAVTALVTEDAGIHRKAGRLGISDRVLTVRDALAQVATLAQRHVDPPPSAELRYLYELNTSDPIFEGLRSDYGTDEFDSWWTRSAQEGRRAFTISSGDDLSHYAGLCVLKGWDSEYGLGARAFKVSTFKVGDEFQGNRYGELLLKALFRHCDEHEAHSVWLTSFDRHEALGVLLADFGFERHTVRTARGEAVWVKRLRPVADEEVNDALDYHVRFGPPALQVRESHVYVVPIQPRFHALLFPDAEPQAELGVESRPFGNAIRKAYLSNASIRRLRPGDVLLFYRSHAYHGVHTVGVVEDVFVSSDADEIAGRVGQRTVYSLEQIRELARREVLVVLFRQDRVLADAISDDELIANGVIARGPQSIASVGAECVRWLADRLAA
jgi:hypothetical protein